MVLKRSLSLLLFFSFACCLADSHTPSKPQELNHSCDKDMQMIFFGKYEDFLEYNQNFKQKIIWEDFYNFQKKLRKSLQQDSVGEVLYFEFISRLISWFNQCQKNIPDHSSAELKKLYEEVFYESKFIFQKQFFQFFCDFYLLAKHDFFIALATSDQAFSEIFCDLGNRQFFEIDLIFTVYTYWILQNEYENPNLIFLNKTQLCLEKFKNIFFDKQFDFSQMAHQYLIFRSKLLDLDLKSPFNEVVTKIATILKLFQPDEAQVLKEALLQLHPDDLALVVEEFSFSKMPKDFLFSRSLVDLLDSYKKAQSFGANSSERLSNSIKIFIPTIAKVLKQQRGMLMRRELDSKKEWLIKIEQKTQISRFSEIQNVDFLLKKEGELILKF